MIFTIGRTTLYDDILEHPENYSCGALYKREGGIVFETHTEAYWYLCREKLKGFEVYGIDAHWDEDTVDIPGVVEMRALITPRPIVTLKEALER